VEIDPGFALAHAGIANVYMGMSTVYMAPDSAIPRVTAAAARALELDPELPEAYAARAYVKAFHDWHWGEAEADYRRALELSPGNASAHWGYGYLLAVNGRIDESIAEMGKAHEIDPLSTFIACLQLWPLYEGRRYDQAIAMAQAIIRDDSTAWDARQVLRQAYTQKREFERAIATERAGRRALRDTTPERPLILIHAMQGQRDLALRELRSEIRRGWRDYYAIGLISGWLGMNDEAFAWLEKEMQTRRESVIWLKVDPDADPLRSDPRFRGLLKRLGFAS